MNKVKRPKIGEYVLLSKFSDKDQNDPWVIGLLEQIRETKESIWYKTDYPREFKHCWRLKEDEGRAILKRLNIYPGNTAQFCTFDSSN